MKEHLIGKIREISGGRLDEDVLNNVFENPIDNIINI